MYMLYYTSDQSLAKDVSVFSRVKSVPFPRCVRGSAVSVPRSDQVKAASGPSCGRITAVFCPAAGLRLCIVCVVRGFSVHEIIIFLHVILHQ